MKFFDVRNVIEKVPDAQIYMFIGERSNGKTYSSLSYALDNYTGNGGRFAYVRRLSESIRAKYMRELFNGNIATGDVNQHMKQLGYEGIMFFSGSFFPYVTDEKGKRQRLEEPIGYTFSINTWETSKGASFPEVTTIIFDEFLTRQYYLPNEPALFENLVSSIVRQRDNVKIIMLANTVSWTAPYFNEWGLSHVREMEQGSWDEYKTGDGKRKIVVCYTEHSGAKASDVYFNYDNPRSRMITSGIWETAMYPKIPDDISEWEKGEPSYVQSIDGWSAKLQPAQTPDGLEVLLVFDNGREILHIDPPFIDSRYKDRIVYTDYFYPCANCRFAITKHTDEYTKFLIECLRQGRVFYANNTVGENIRNYLMFSTKYTPIPN